MDMHSLLLAKMMLGGGGNVEVESPEIPLNMSEGNQIILPSEGKLISQATIVKPETLIPENIAEGIDIGGVIGTLVAGGGGGGEIKRVWQSFNVSSWSWGSRVSMDIGFVPDILMMYLSGSYTPTSSQYGYFWFGVSRAFAEKSGNYSNFAIGGSSSSIKQSGHSIYIDDAKYANAAFSEADATGFVLGNRNPATNTSYTIVAIGGLT